MKIQNLLLSALVLTGLGLIFSTGSVHANSFTFGGDYAWDQASCTATINGIARVDRSVAPGDTVTMTLRNTSSYYTRVSVSSQDDSDIAAATLAPGQSFSRTYTNRNLDMSTSFYNPAEYGACNSGTSARIKAYIVKADLTCSYANGQYTIKGTYLGGTSDPLNLYKDATLLKTYTNEFTNTINVTTPATTSGGTVVFYNGSRGSNDVIATTACPAATSASIGSGSTGSSSTTTSGSSGSGASSSTKPASSTNDPTVTTQSTAEATTMAAQSGEAVTTAAPVSAEDAQKSAELNADETGAHQAGTAVATVVVTIVAIGGLLAVIARKRPELLQKARARLKLKHK